MSFVHGKSTVVLIDGTDMSGYFNSSDFTQSVETAETTTYQKSNKTYIGGVKDGTLSLGGFFDAAADALLQAQLANTTGKTVMIGYEGLAVGAKVKTLLSRITSYQASSPVGDVVTGTLDIQGEGGLDSGVSLHALTAETATANGTSVDNGAATTNGGVGTLQVTAYSGFTSVAVKIQHSTDNSAWADLITFASVTATGSQRIELAAGSTVNRYVRVIWTVTGTGSITFTSTFARR